MPFKNLSEHMHVIGHDDPSVKACSLPFKMLERVCDDRRALGTTQETCAMPLIQPALDGSRESFCMSEFNFSGPRLRIECAPCGFVEAVLFQ